MKKEIPKKATLRAVRAFSGNYVAKQNVKHLKAGEEIHLNVVTLMSVDKVMIFNNNSEKVPFFMTIYESQFSDYFTEIL
ncbi:hypothetical protein [Dyadobacter psychrotolerans]|uniref:Uncharacterized protein n=1 Tax=Dyadobacter psychrotolerans TaxID=2541721 RepID=A0A4R5DLY5_9BACT|nr:hypothetical protein [Dyadobacter psychrotolerans]TDE15276.1 hypothetical protein E0F88_12190 [Dyadobacter psychrotolerans]